MRACVSSTITLAGLALRPSLLPKQNVCFSRAAVQNVHDKIRCLLSLLLNPYQSVCLLYGSAHPPCMGREGEDKKAMGKGERVLYALMQQSHG